MQVRHEANSREHARTREERREKKTREKTSEGREGGREGGVQLPPSLRCSFADARFACAPPLSLLSLRVRIRPLFRVGLRRRRRRTRRDRSRRYSAIQTQV